MNEQKYLSVSALTEYIKVKLENDNHLKRVFLKGEISNFTHHGSGHLYFSLKDEDAAISAMMFKTYASTLSFKPKAGDKVLVEGYISLYKARGTYSISIFSMTLDGIGELFLKYEQNRKMFQELGYFDESLKKPIPKFPKIIAVITSETGAVIQDIKTTISRRYLLAKIELYPILVQGEGSKDDIVRTLARVNKESQADVIILGRGGGSIEDLWSFNEAEVVVAIHQSKIPVITAIGHETDTTLSDYVSDLRAPTPTAAAELATPNMVDLIKEIKDKVQLSQYYMNERIKNYTQLLLNLDERLELASPKSKLELEHKQIDNLTSKLTYFYKSKLTDNLNKVRLLSQRLTSPDEKIERYKERIETLTSRINLLYKKQVDLKTYEYQSSLKQLQGLDPLRIMQRGFSLTTKNQKVITSIEQINTNDELDIQYKDGTAKVKVLSKEGKHI
ncbi:exodeoxyribonuclease VII large subunit [Acholeplasma laidlawii]|uniref:exodeoxyribonuclease VII large subunit n=1 Tax=Acholeplasma laidlawii TaxID=2148 RepID=UPI0018C24F3B|nr:exodeoxyribonuclease VII large subunit [Acholeplasma laidlawii]MBG0762675.1 exodeoxyribonuclease VII large subunit [Acholeplasma laidlawii]